MSVNAPSKPAPAVTVRRVGYALGAEITGVDASKPVDDATVAQIRKAMIENVVVYLPGQNLGPKELSAFAARFGELDLYNIQQLQRHPDVPSVIVRANKPVDVEGKQTLKQSHPANTWHTDYSHSKHPAAYSFLFGKELPRIGGDTMFASMYAAYETLSPAYKALIDTRLGVHDVALGGGYKNRSAEARTESHKIHPPIAHPLVQTHEETGRKHLFIGDRCFQIAGMTTEESTPILDYLKAHAIRYEFIYRHRWTQGDLVIWDNRCTMHYAVQDYDAEMRMLLRASLLGPERGEYYTNPQ